MKLHETRLIKRPLDEVFSFTSDFANSEKWDPGVESSKQVSDGPVGVGTRYDLVTRFGSSRIPMTYVIEEFEPNRRVVLRGEGGPVSAVDEIVFEQRGEGTWVDYTADLSFDNWIKWVSPIMKPIMSRLVGEKALNGLVETLES
ncbi:MAG TPA: SRPBCC family protein [Acidimicrobiia bacterium]|nr:SRPBCC family protein [Acidimicrobiia bacterium]